MTFEEKEKRTKEAILKVEAEIHLTELELHSLKEERDKLRKGATWTRKAAAEVQESTPALATSRGGLQEEPPLSLPRPSWNVEREQHGGHSNYGHSWRRSRECRHNRSRSRSDSSETRRRRSKWLLKHHTVGGKTLEYIYIYIYIVCICE